MKKTISLFCVPIIFLFSVTSLAKSSDWSTYKSANFELHTDAKKRDAEKLLKNFERFHELIFAVTGVEKKVDRSRLKIIKYAQNNDFRALTGDMNTIGVYYRTESGPKMLAGPSFSLGSDTTLFHEYVHHVMHQQGSYNYPRWYDEGFAELLAATKMTSNNVILGAIPEYRARDLRPIGDNGSLGKLSVKELITEENSNETPQYRQRFYATSWLLMHYIQISPVQNKLPLQQQTAEYNRRVSLGENPESAFRASFKMRTRDMDGELKKYFMLSRFPEIKLKFPQYSGPISEKKLSETEANLLLADIAYRAGANENALEYLSEIDANDKSASAAFALKALIAQTAKDQQTTINQQPLIQQAESRGQNDSVALTYLAKNYWHRFQNEKSEETLAKTIELSKKAVALDAGSQEAQMQLARSLSANNQSTDALKSFMAAYEINPTSANLNGEIGDYLLTLGEAKLAKSFYERLLIRAQSKRQRTYAKERIAEIDKHLKAAS